MKKILALAMFCMLFKGAYSQNEEWVNRILYESTEQCVDSFRCYTQVIMEINPAVVPDSAWMWLKIGTTPGADDIYSKKFQKTPTIFTLPEVGEENDKNITISLGSYLIEGSFFVDLGIEYQW